MGICSPLNPYGNPDLMVDKHIGGAYPIVKFVAENMERIIEVANAIDMAGPGEPLLVRRSMVIEDITSASRTTPTVLALPSNINVANIIDVSAKVIGSDGRVFFNGSGTHFVHIDQRNLVLELDPGVPDVMLNAHLHWFIIFGVPV